MRVLVSVTATMNEDVETELTWPVPLHVEHLECVVPGSAFLPLHLSQTTDVLIVISLLHPLAASMNDRFSMYYYTWGEHRAQWIHFVSKLWQWDQEQ